MRAHPSLFPGTMKKRIFSALIVIVLLGCSHLSAHFFDTSLEKDHAVTVREYCAFLNGIAASDPHHLYEEKMASGLATDCMRRSGALGSYHYEVIEGQENAPVVWVSYLSAIRYCHWQENRKSESAGAFETTDDENIVLISAYHSASTPDCCDLALLQSSHPSILEKRKDQTGTLSAVLQGELDGGLLLLALVAGGSSMRERTSSVTDEENLRKASDVRQGVARRSASIPQRDGLTGISNFTGQCGLNSAVQLLRKASQIILEQGTPEEQERLCATIDAKMPHFGRFLRQEFKTEEDCRALHQEVGKQLPPAFVANRFSDLRSMVQRRGVSLDCPIRGVSSETFLPCLLKHLTMRPDALVMLTFENYQKSPFSTLQHCLDSSLLQQGGSLVAPLPSALVVVLRSFSSATEVVKTITLPDKDGAPIAYQPKAISCRVPQEGSKSSHAFALIKEKESWYEVNDARIFHIPHAWEDEMKRYCSKHVSVILYEKKNADDKPSSRYQQSSETLLETLESLEHVCGLSAGFLGSAEEAKEMVFRLWTTDWKERSFFGGKAYQVLSEHQNAIMNAKKNTPITLESIGADMKNLTSVSNVTTARILLTEAQKRTCQVEKLWQQTLDARKIGLVNIPQHLPLYWHKIFVKAKEYCNRCSSVLAELEAQRKKSTASNQVQKGYRRNHKSADYDFWD